jgi:hypothetical protein
MQSELDVREFRMNLMPIAEILNAIGWVKATPAQTPKPALALGASFL